MTTSDPTGGGSRDPFELLLDLALYAPVGAAITLRHELPKHVKQGRQALENRVQLARFIGQLAVQTGQREIAKRLREQREAREAAMAEPSAAEAAPTVGDDVGAGPAEPAEPAEPAPAATRAADDVPSAADLPIGDYESVPAINVVERLRSMTADEVEQIRLFEVAHRGRRTILAKIDQLQHD